MVTKTLLARVGIATLALALSAASSAAQNDPHLGYAYPAGGRQGEVLEVRVGGQFLGGVHDVYVDGVGLRGAVIAHHRALSRKDLGELRKRIGQLRNQKRNDKPVDPEVEPREYEGRPLARMSVKELDELRAQLFDPKRQPNAQLGETVVLHVAIAADAPPGPRELRLRTPAGLSNPLRFQVGRWAEHREREPNDRRADDVTSVALPVVLNGQILPGDIDRFRFRARAAQDLVVSVQARDLIPYLADAVPGWFQATLALYDAAGEELAYVDDYRFHPDPVLHFRIPADGEYVLEIRDSIHRGREDFVYRVSLGELPFVTGIFPLGGPAGESTTVELSGWNLPVHELTVGGEKVRPGIVPLAVEGVTANSSRVPFAVGTMPETTEVEPNDEPAEAKWPSRPKIVNGRIGRPGDRDVFRLTGRAGDEIVAEVTARRLQSPLDSVLWVTDAEGRELARNDDHADRGAGLTTHQADSWLSCTLPADGDYFLHLADAQHKGGDAYAYRLRISDPRPDYALRIVPSSVNVRAGTTTSLTVHALRRDGFTGAIGLRLKDAPPGFVLGGGRIPPGRDQVQVTLTAPAKAIEEPLRLVVVGKAKIGARDVLRTAVPSEDMMQAFLNRHLVPANELLVTVGAKRGGVPPLRYVEDQPVRLRPGGTATVRLRGPRRAPRGKLVLELRDAPAGVTLGKLSPIGPETSFVLHADADVVEPGWQGNALVEVFVVRQVKAQDGSPTKRTRRTSLGLLPALRLAITRSG